MTPFTALFDHPQWMALMLAFVHSLWLGLATSRLLPLPHKFGDDIRPLLAIEFSEQLLWAGRVKLAPPTL